MATVLNTWNPEIFQTIPEVQDAAESFREKVDVEFHWNELKRIFEKHGMCQKFNLVMLHRYFQLERNEILVETQNETLSVTMPWTVTRNTAQPENQAYWNTFGFAEPNYVIAQSWAFEPETGKPIPFEFFATEKEEFEPVKPPAQFAGELFEKLRELGVSRVFGIRLQQSATAPEAVGWESRQDATRASIVLYDKVPPPNEKRALAGSWNFGHLENEGLADSAQSCRPCSFIFSQAL